MSRCVPTPLSLRVPGRPDRRILLCVLEVDVHNCFPASTSPTNSNICPLFSPWLRALNHQMTAPELWPALKFPIGHLPSQRKCTPIRALFLVHSESVKARVLISTSEGCITAAK
eukprot:1138073-Pelagomonas_calceolata.AAC.3